jgi:glycosyltransferase involved in cell wall biosynthesis
MMMNEIIMDMDFDKPLVIIRCTTYNQAPYIRDCLDGFIMQQTTFPFYAVVHDDASTDGTADIVREYAEKYPDIIHPIFETENQYSKQDGSLRRIMNEATKTAKYVAMCEGDDYWTDPLKLQKQVNYMEKHNDCCMTASASIWLKDGEVFKNHRISDTPRNLTTKEVILGGGGYLATCSLVYDRNKLDGRIPEWRRMANVGDYPLQIQGTLEGKLYYFTDAMCVYRYRSKGSWTEQFLGKQKEQTLLHRQAEIKWMIELEKATKRKYQREICQRLKPYVRENYLNNMALFKDYFHVMLVVGNRNDFKRMIIDVIKQVLNWFLNLTNKCNFYMRMSDNKHS